MRLLASHDQREPSILVSRGHRVLWDTELAKLYGVLTNTLNQSLLDICRTPA